MVERADDRDLGADVLLRRASVTLDRSGNVPRAARRFVADALRGWGWGELGDVELLVSELASNAIQHSASPTVVVDVGELASGRVRVQVANEGTGAPSPQPPDPRRIGGHGLAVVAELAAAWGVHHPEGATVVWFDLVGAPG